MCTSDFHCFIWVATKAQPRQPIGHPCVCGQRRFGTAAELRALDETARLEAWLAVPWREGA